MAATTGGTPTTAPAIATPTLAEIPSTSIPAIGTPSTTPIATPTSTAGTETTTLTAATGIPTTTLPAAIGPTQAISRMRAIVPPRRRRPTAATVKSPRPAPSRALTADTVQAVKQGRRAAVGSRAWAVEAGHNAAHRQLAAVAVGAAAANGKSVASG